MGQNSFTARHAERKKPRKRPSALKVFQVLIILVSVCLLADTLFPPTTKPHNPFQSASTVALEMFYASIPLVVVGGFALAATLLIRILVSPENRR
jgi:hypothetical protein